MSVIAQYDENTVFRGRVEVWKENIFSKFFISTQFFQLLVQFFLVFSPPHPTHVFRGKLNSNNIVMILNQNGVELDQQKH